VDTFSTFAGIKAIQKVGAFARKLKRPMTGNHITRRNGLISPVTCEHDSKASNFKNIFSARPGSSTTKSSMAATQFDFKHLKTKVKAKEYSN